MEDHPDALVLHPGNESLSEGERFVRLLQNLSLHRARIRGCPLSACGEQGRETIKGGNIAPLGIAVDDEAFLPDGRH